MIELNVTNLVGGDITITTGGSAPASHPETRFTLEGGTVETYNITGTLDQQWMIDNGYFDKTSGTWLESITQADIGNTVTSIGAGAFYGLENLNNVTISNSVTSINNLAFFSCTGLTNVTIPDSVTNIVDYAFESCSNLTSVTIGSGIQEIGYGAFNTYVNPITLTIGKTISEVQEMGQTNYDYHTNTTYLEWGLPSNSTIVCTDGTITIS